MLLKAKITNFKMPSKLQHSQKIKNDKKYLEIITSTWISKTIYIKKNPETKNNKVTNFDISSSFLSKNKTTHFKNTLTDQFPIELIKFDPSIILMGKRRKIIKVGKERERNLSEVDQAYKP